MAQEFITKCDLQLPYKDPGDFDGTGAPDHIAENARKTEQWARRFRKDCLSGGGGAPTVVVAAADATSYSISKADFLCTGTNDNDVMDLAIAAADGGRVLMTEGTYTFGEQVYFDGVDIEGMGRGTHIIPDPSFSANNPLFRSDTGDITRSGIRNLRLDGNGVALIRGIQCDISSDRHMFEGVWVEDLDRGINLSDTSDRASTITGCVFIGCETGLRAVRGAQVAVVGNSFISNTIGFHAATVTFDAGHFDLVGNQFYDNGDGARIDTRLGLIAGNYFSALSNQNGINMSAPGVGGGAGLAIFANQIVGLSAPNIGVRISDGWNVSIKGNHLDSLTTAVSFLNNAKYNFVSDNTFYGGTTAVSGPGSEQTFFTNNTVDYTTTGIAGDAALVSHNTFLNCTNPITAGVGSYGAGNYLNTVWVGGVADLANQAVVHQMMDHEINVDLSELSRLRAAVSMA